MDREQFQQTTDALFDALEKKRRPVRILITATKMDKIYGNFAKVYYPMIGIGVAAGVFYLSNGQEQDNIAGQVLMSVMIGGVSAFMSAIVGDSMRKFFGGDMPEKALLKLAMSSAGYQTPIDKAQAATLVKWGEKYPRIRDICIQWGSENGDALFTEQQFNTIGATIDRVESHEKSHAEWLKNQKQRDDVESEFQKGGLMDAITANNQQKTLLGDTVEVKAPTRPMGRL